MVLKEENKARTPRKSKRPADTPDSQTPSKKAARDIKQVHLVTPTRNCGQLLDLTSDNDDDKVNENEIILKREIPERSISVPVSARGTLNNSKSNSPQEIQN